MLPIFIRICINRRRLPKGKVSLIQKKSVSHTLKLFGHKIDAKSPFTFIRFSDGELEIILNNRLRIDEAGVAWSGMQVSASYPQFDFKTFEPGTKQAQYFRQDLLASAVFSENNYFKGIPTSRNSDLTLRKLMVGLNGGSYLRLTSNDLLINSNYLFFLKKMLPKILMRRNLYLLGNWRMRPALLEPEMGHLKVPDNFFSGYPRSLETVSSEAFRLPQESTLLSSASSFSNILGLRLRISRPDITFIDVGTSLHHLAGLPGNFRGYHALLDKPFAAGRVRQVLAKSHKVGW